MESIKTRHIEKASARREHFERGGTPAMWRGASKRFKDRRKEENRNNCRNVKRNED
jgi:hypothetical protein